MCLFPLQDPYEEEFALATNQSLLPTAEREFQDLDDRSQDYHDYQSAKRFAQADIAERRPRVVHDYSKIQRYSNGDLNSSCRRSKNDHFDADEFLGSSYAQVNQSVMLYVAVL